MEKRHPELFCKSNNIFKNFRIKHFAQIYMNKFTAAGVRTNFVDVVRHIGTEIDDVTLFKFKGQIFMAKTSLSTVAINKFCTVMKCLSNIFIIWVKI